MGVLMLCSTIYTYVLIMGGSRLGGLWSDNSADTNCHSYSMCTPLHSSISPSATQLFTYSQGQCKVPFPLTTSCKCYCCINVTSSSATHNTNHCRASCCCFALWLFSFFLLSFWLWTNSFFKIPFERFSLRTLHLSTDSGFILSEVLLQSTGTHQLPLMKCLVGFFLMTQGKKLSWLLSSLLNDSATQICSKMCEKPFCKQNYLSKMSPIALVLYKSCVNSMGQVKFNPGLSLHKWRQFLFALWDAVTNSYSSTWTSILPDCYPWMCNVVWHTACITNRKSFRERWTGAGGRQASVQTIQGLNWLSLN